MSLQQSGRMADPAIASIASYTRWIVPAVVGFAVLGLLNGSYFVVPQTDVAFVKRFCKVQDPQAGPLQPGLHFKAPVIDDPDLIRITTDTFELPEKKAFTKDTQEITLRVGVTYRVPTTATYHLLYEIGKAGNVDIHSNIILLSNEVVREVLSKHTITEIAGEQRESVVTDIKARLTDVLASILRIEVSAVQINSLDFSPQYKDAINQATLARTKTFAAQQDAERAKVEAQTRVTHAQAEAEALRLRGEGDAAATRARIEAAGGPDNYIRQIDAQSKLRWNGQVPQFMLGGSGANAPTVPIILPMTPPVSGSAQSAQTPAPAQAAR